MTNFLSINKESPACRCFKHHLTKNVDYIRTASTIFLDGQVGVDTYLITNYDNPNELDPLLQLVNLTGGTLFEFPKSFKNLARLIKSISTPTRFIWSFSATAPSTPSLSASWELTNLLSAQQKGMLTRTLDTVKKKAQGHYQSPTFIEKGSGRLTTSSSSQRSIDQIRTSTKDYVEEKPSWQKKFQKLHEMEALVTGSVLMAPAMSHVDQNEFFFDYLAISEFGFDEEMISTGIADLVSKLLSERGLKNIIFNKIAISTTSPYLLSNLAVRLTEQKALKAAHISADDLFFGWAPFSTTLDILSEEGSCLSIVINDHVSIITKVLKT